MYSDDLLKILMFIYLLNLNVYVIPCKNTYSKKNKTCKIYISENIRKNLLANAKEIVLVELTST